MIHTHSIINSFELPVPMYSVQERSVVEAVVVGTVRLCVVRRSEYCHLVTIDCVATEEVLHFFCHLENNLYCDRYRDRDKNGIKSSSISKEVVLRRSCLKAAESRPEIHLISTYAE